MRYVAAFIAFAFSCLIYPVPAQARIAIGSHLTVVMEYDQKYSTSSMEAMEEEVRNLLRRTGVRISFRKKEEVLPNEEFEELILVRFRGVCSLSSTSDKSTETSRILGWSHVMSGEVLPFGDVSCDNVRRVVQGALSGSPEHRERLYGRALARVVSHEMYHIIGGTHLHGKKGIAQASLSGQDLVSERIELAMEDMERMIRRPAFVPGTYEDYTEGR